MTATPTSEKAVNPNRLMGYAILMGIAAIICFYLALAAEPKSISFLMICYTAGLVVHIFLFIFSVRKQPRPRILFTDIGSLVLFANFQIAMVLLFLMVFKVGVSL